jgi:hypothetical protein
MRGAIPPLPNTLSWRGVQLKHRITLPLPVQIHGTEVQERNANDYRTYEFVIDL